MSEPDAPTPSEHEADHEMPLPPATFDFFVLSLKMQAEMSLGLIHFGEEKDRPKPDLRVARHSIDLLAMIQEKTRGNLSMDEQRLIENSLTELRFRYVQVMESQGPAKSQDPSTS
jgi:Domain of unknown function (DUF1844)